MPRDLTMQQAADVLGVSRRRVQAMVDSGQLRGFRAGHQWLFPIEELRRLDLVRVARPGRPLSQRAAWQLIARRDGTVPASRAEADDLRRRLRSRARHVDVYVHPSIGGSLATVDGLVIGGREAADAVNIPAGPGSDAHAYVRSYDAGDAIRRTHAELDPESANLHLHIVDDQVWPFGFRTRHTSPLVAWLDLADEDDRAANLIYDRLSKR